MDKTHTISCVIVDDEISSQQVIKHFIADTEGLRLEQVCNNSQEAFKYLQLNPEIDLLFLDINMPGQSGLDFYKSLRSAPAVIFTTAYSEFAINGFELEAIDYLLKPIAYNRFLVAVNKFINSQKTDDQEDAFITIKENKTLHKVNFVDISFVEAFGDYVKVYLKDKTIVTHSTFSGFLKKLPKYFLRTHKSYSVNLNKLSQVSGNQIMLGAHNIPIGQTYKGRVLKALKL